jgi:hypothetical protein
MPAKPWTSFELYPHKIRASVHVHTSPDPLSTSSPPDASIAALELNTAHVTWVYCLLGRPPTASTTPRLALRLIRQTKNRCYSFSQHRIANVYLVFIALSIKNQETRTEERRKRDIHTGWSYSVCSTV